MNDSDNCNPFLLPHLRLIAQACESPAVEQALTDARKFGIDLQAGSKFQRASHALLENVWSSLSMQELRMLEMTCRRWHAASRFAAIGWREVLSRSAVTKEWATELLKRGIRAETLTEIKHITCALFSLSLR